MSRNNYCRMRRVDSGKGQIFITETVIALEQVSLGRESGVHSNLNRLLEY